METAHNKASRTIHQYAQCVTKNRLVFLFLLLIACMFPRPSRDDLHCSAMSQVGLFYTKRGWQVSRKDDNADRVKAAESNTPEV